MLWLHLSPTQLDVFAHRWSTVFLEKCEQKGIDPTTPQVIANGKRFIPGHAADIWAPADRLSALSE
jgi:hypothetical protein